MVDNCQKVLTVDPELCTGCRICELRCSLYHNRESNPSKALLHVVRLESQGLFIPTLCRNCTEAFCMYACPTGAITRKSSTDAVVVDAAKCAGCRSCIAACPWGLIWMSSEGRIEKCDLCDGDPQCARWCPTEAIQYVDRRRQHLKKMTRAAIKNTPAVHDREILLQKIYYSGRNRLLNSEKGK